MRSPADPPVPISQPSVLDPRSDRTMSTSNETRTDLGAFVLRVTLGVMFVSHALLKYFVFTLPGTVQFFGSLGLPPALAYLTFGAELVGGTLLLLGVYSRYVSIALIPILIGA